MNKVLVSCLVLNGSKSGYRRIIKNMIMHKSKYAFGIDYYFVISHAGFASLELDIDDYSNIILVNSTKSKYFRVLYEQLIIPLLAMKIRANKIFMPATFGLLLPVKKTVTFVHTNTMFMVNKKLRGVSILQGFLQRALVKMTYYTSSKLLFTTAQTYSEHAAYCGSAFPPRILGNGVITFEKDAKASNLNLSIPEKYILSVSQFYRLKRQDLLIRIFIELKDENLIQDDYFLILVGTIQEGDYFSEIQDVIRPRHDIKLFNSIGDYELDLLYQRCQSYVFLSSFEGYSLTPAEALLRKKNIFLSDIPTHKEVYEELATFADITDFKNLKDELKNFINGPSSAIDEAEVMKRFSFKSFMFRLSEFMKT